MHKQEKFTDGQIIELLIKDLNISQAEFADRTGLMKSTLSGIKNQRFIKGEHVAKICDGLGMERWEFYMYPYKEILNKYLPPWISTEISEMIRKIGQLDENKQLMIWTTIEQLLKLLLNKEGD